MKEVKNNVYILEDKTIITPKYGVIIEENLVVIIDNYNNYHLLNEFLKSFYENVQQNQKFQNKKIEVISYSLGRTYPFKYTVKDFESVDILFEENLSTEVMYFHSFEYRNKSIAIDFKYSKYFGGFMGFDRVNKVLFLDEDFIDLIKQNTKKDSFIKRLLKMKIEYVIIFDFGVFPTAEIIKFN